MNYFSPSFVSLKKPVMSINRILLQFTLICALLLNSCVAQESNDSLKKSSNMKYNELSDQEKNVIINKATDRPFTGDYYKKQDKGLYICRQCNNPLYTSEDKFDSHCGWPSFDKELKKGVIKETVDNTMGMRRIEITCGKCGGHLGHVFDDGPTETGLRYCVNSVSIGFEKTGN